MKMALMMYPALRETSDECFEPELVSTYKKRSRKPSWSLGWRSVSKIDKHISPTVPAMANTTMQSDKVADNIAS